MPVGNSIESLPFLEPFIKMVYMNVLIVFQSQMQAEVRRYLVYKTTGHDRSFDRTITTLSTDDDIRASTSELSHRMAICNVLATK